MMPGSMMQEAQNEMELVMYARNYMLANQEVIQGTISISAPGCLFNAILVMGLLLLLFFLLLLYRIKNCCEICKGLHG